MDNGARQELTGLIARELAKGIVQPAQTWLDLESWLGSADENFLLKLLSSPDSSEAASLIDLLLSPSRELRLELEPELARYAAQSQDLPAMAELLAETCPILRAILPQATEISLEFNPACALRLLERLRPQHNPPTELREIIEQRMSWNLGLEFKLCLRDFFKTFSPMRNNFLARLLTRLEPASQGLELFGYALDLLACLPESFEPELELAQKRQNLLNQLKQAEFQAQGLEKGNFETMLASGARIMSLPEEEIRRELRLLDTLSLYTLGRLAGAGIDAPHQEEETTLENADDILAYFQKRC